MELFENWSETKSALLEGLNERKAKMVDVCLENTKNFILKEGTQAGAIANTYQTLIPMIRRIIPSTIATEIVGSQPMSGPVGLVYSLRFIFTDNMDAPGTAYDIVGGSTEVFGNNGKMRRFYSGDETTGEAQATAALEGSLNRGIQLEVLRQTVTAGTRKLNAKWTIEAMQDLSAQHGLDLESEVTAASSAAVVQEIDNEIITDLLNLAGTSETFDMFATFTGTPHYVGDRFAVLGVLINKVANEIARKTRRGPGNFIVVSPIVASVLQSASKSVFAPAVSGSFEGPNNTKLIGMLNGMIKVYTYIYEDQTGLPAGQYEPVLVGYKGGASEIDSGYFYCPYVPLMTVGPVTDPNTMNSVVMLMTRYGKATFTNTSTSLGNSADYYGRVDISNLTFV